MSCCCCWARADPLAAGSIASQLSGSDAIHTVLAMMAVTTLATGLAFLVMGYFGMGEIARFMPFPVIGGLLAGTGYLIIMGAVGILGIGSPEEVGAAESIGSFWPGLALAILFFLAPRLRWPSWTYLAFLAGGVVGFHIFTRLAGLDREILLERGWLLGPFPEGGLWPGPVTDALAGANWGAIGGQTATLAAILLIVPISLLFYVSAVEVETRSDLDMNAELRTTGWANVAAAAVGSAPGYLYLADTVITQRLVGKRRGSALVAAIAMLGMLVVGGAVVGALPQFIVGGLLLFVGFDFMVEWLWSSRRRMTSLDNVLMWLIVLIVATVGFLPGVAVGLVAAIVLFVVRYSRIDVVKHALTGKEHHNNIERPSRDAEYLEETGDSVLILELQGFIFFGTASRLIRHIRSHLDREDPVKYFIADFRRVTGVDSSAVMLLERVVMLARDHGAWLVLTYEGVRQGLGDPCLGVDLRGRGPLPLRPGRERHSPASRTLAQELLHHVVVRLRPEPAATQLPAVDDVAHEVEVVARVGLEEVQQRRGLTARRAQVQVGDEHGAQPLAAAVLGLRVGVLRREAAAQGAQGFEGRAHQAPRKCLR